MIQNDTITRLLGRSWCRSSHGITFLPMEVLWSLLIALEVVPILARKSCHQSHLLKGWYSYVTMWVNAGHIKYCRSSKQNSRLWVSTLIVSVLTHHLWPDFDWFTLPASSLVQYNPVLAGWNSLHPKAILATSPGLGLNYTKQLEREPSSAEDLQKALSAHIIPICCLPPHSATPACHTQTSTKRPLNQLPFLSQGSTHRSFLIEISPCRLSKQLQETPLHQHQVQDWKANSILWPFLNETTSNSVPLAGVNDMFIGMWQLISKLFTITSSGWRFGLQQVINSHGVSSWQICLL